MRRIPIRKLILPPLAALGLLAWPWLSGCAPRSRESDAGDFSFVHQAVPKLLGRKVKGYVETKMLMDFIGAADRRTMVEALAETPEFRRHWAENLVDMLRMHREGTKSQSLCLGEPMRASVDNGELAAHIRDNAPTTPAPGGAFNLSDVIRSSLALDDLFPVWRAWLFAMQSKPLSGAEITEQNKRDDMASEFQAVFLHRKLDCMACHNGQFSTTGAHTGWNRHWTIPGYFEKAVYGRHRGRDPDEANAVFRSTSGGQQPWGMQSCGAFNPAPGPDELGVDAYFTQPRGTAGSIWTVDQALSEGRADLDAGGLERANTPEDEAACDVCGTCVPAPASPIDPEASPGAAEVAAIISARCEVCHSGGAPDGDLDLSGPDWATNLIRRTRAGGGPTRVLPGDPDGSFLFQRVRDNEMPPPPAMPLTTDQKDDINAWITGLPAYLGCTDCEPAPCDGFPRTVDAEAGLTYLLAAQIVNQVWMEVLGYPLTVAHYLPRNPEQRNLHWNLAEYNFINKGWSLRGLLGRIMSSEYFNRKAPYLGDGDEPYELPMFYDPWVERDPRVPVTPANPDGPDRHKNAMTEAIHRYSPHSLLFSAHASTGWTAPPRFPGSGANYPNQTLAKELGYFYKAAEPGFREVGFQALLRWESIHGGGNKPTGFTGDDWIDRVMAAIPLFNADHPGAPLTYLDLANVVKDWFINERGATADAFGEAVGEFDALRAVFGTANLNLPAPVATQAERDALAAGMRLMAGTLMETPHFWLAGIGPTEGTGPADAPRLRVCNSPPCTYQEMCQALAPAANEALPGTKELFCHSDHLEVKEPPAPPGRGVVIFPPYEWCPPGLCGFVELPCVDDLFGCRPTPPGCDPRCALVDCCGGPLPPLDRKGYFLMWADLAEVSQAEGVGLVRGGRIKPSPLQPKTVLRTGDILLVDEASALNIRGKEGRIRLKRGQLKGLPKGRRITFLITGEDALPPKPPRHADPKPWQQVDHKVIQNWFATMPWLRHGSAGGPPHPRDKQAFDPRHAQRKPETDSVRHQKQQGR